MFLSKNVFTCYKTKANFNYFESLEKSQKSGSSLPTESSVKTHYLMTHGSFLSSLVPLPLVPRLLLILFPPSSLTFSVCFLMDTNYLTATFLFKNLLTQKGNLINQLHEGLHCESIGLNLWKRKENSRYKQLVSGWEGLQEYYSWRVLAVNSWICSLSASLASNPCPGFANTSPASGLEDEYNRVLLQISFWTKLRTRDLLFFPNFSVCFEVSSKTKYKQPPPHTH